MEQPAPHQIDEKKRQLLIAAGAAAALPLLCLGTVSNALAATGEATPRSTREGKRMTTSTVKTKDGVEIFYKDWGSGTPIVFSHGWPLSSDDWDGQMMFFLQHGYRVIAHDRRGHGRSTQTATGNDMDTYAADVAELVAALKPKNPVHIGHSTGGGEVVHYAAKLGKGLVSKAVLVSAVPPVMVQSASNPDGVPKQVFDGIRAGTAFNRPQFYADLTIPFYGYNRPDAKVSQGVRDNWW